MIYKQKQVLNFFEKINDPKQELTNIIAVHEGVHATNFP